MSWPRSEKGCGRPSRIHAEGIEAPLPKRSRVQGRLAATGAILLSIFGAAPAEAQWAIGPPGPRTAPSGLNHYLYLVRSTPLPGLEQAFNDAYQNRHMGDLIELEGWVGAQRFRAVSDGQPRSILPGSRWGYLVVWDQEGQTPPTVPLGGRNRRIPGYDYATPGANWQATYKAIGPRRRRADGKGPTVFSTGDHETPRLNRYVLLEFAEPPAGMAATEFEATLDRRVGEILALPGWLTAQRWVLTPTPAPSGRAARAPPPADRYLTLWEIEGRSAVEVQQALLDATKAGKVEVLAADPATVEATYWEPISPYVTKEDIDR